MTRWTFVVETDDDTMSPDTTPTAVANDVVGQFDSGGGTVKIVSARPGEPVNGEAPGPLRRPVPRRDDAAVVDFTDLSVRVRSDGVVMISADDTLDMVYVQRPRAVDGGRHHRPVEVGIEPDGTHRTHGGGLIGDPGCSCGPAHAPATDAKWLADPLCPWHGDPTRGAVVLTEVRRLLADAEAASSAVPTGSDADVVVGTLVRIHDAIEKARTR